MTRLCRLWIVAVALFETAARAQCPAWQPGLGMPGVSGSTGTHVSAMIPWDPDGAGPLESVLVVAGTFEQANGVTARGVATWDGASLRGLGTQLLAASFDGRALAVYQGDLYMGAYPGSSGGPGLFRWTGSAWTVVSPPVNGHVNALIVYENRLVVAGLFSQAGTTLIRNIARWDGSALTAMPNLDLGAQGIPDQVYSLGLDPTGRLWAGADATGTPSTVATWWFRNDGTGVGWTRTAQVNGPSGAAVKTFATHQGEFYAGASSNTSVNARFTHLVPGSDPPRWEPGPGAFNDGVCALTSDGGTLFAGGTFTAVDNVSAINVGRFNGTSWAPMGAGAGAATATRVDCLVLYKNDVYAGGLFTDMDGGRSSHIARWTDSQWFPLGNGPTGDLTSSSFAGTAVAEVSGGLVASVGTSAPGAPSATFGPLHTAGIARLDGETWSALGAGFASGSASDMVVYQGDLIAAGNLVLPGNTAISIARFHGGAWSSLAFLDAEARALAEFENHLIVGGSFISVSGQNLVYIARWDGSAWHPMGALSGPVSELLVFDQTLYAGGRFPGRVARWDGEAWTSLPAITAMQEVSALAVYGGRLHAAGVFADGSYHSVPILRLDGATWTTLGTLEGVFPFGASLTGHDDSLILGGRFESVAGVITNNIARWNGQSWSGFGSGIGAPGSGDVLSLAAIGEDVFAAGRFASADGVPATRLARWGCPRTHCYADCDSNQALNVNDFVCFQTRFAAASLAADCTRDGLLNVNDFVCFQSAFAAGCR